MKMSVNVDNRPRKSHLMCIPEEADDRDKEEDVLASLTSHQTVGEPLTGGEPGGAHTITTESAVLFDVCDSI